MEEKNALGQILELLAEHEQSLAQLYDLYAQQFGDYRDFWFELAHDKRNHAGWIRMLRGGIYAGDITFKKDRFNLDELQRAIVFIRVQIDTTYCCEVTLMRAFSTAVGLEETSLEKGFFNIFEGDAAQLQHILIDVRVSVNEHCKKIRSQYDQIRAGLRYE